MSNTITAKQAEEWLKAGQGVLIDVREPDEFKGEHIAYALSVPLAQVGSVVGAMELPADRKLITQCLAGKRGEQACATLAGADSVPHEVFNIEGGINAWKEAGLPVVSSGGAGGPKISIFRQVQIIMGFLIAALIIFDMPVLAAIFALALGVAGVTGWCGLAMALHKAPWNK